jgi:hypothetical protein
MQLASFLKGKRFAALLLLVGCCLLGACGKKEQVPLSSVSNTQDPQWIYRSKPNARVALVFVHGIFGETVGTWTNASGKRFFDYLQESPQMNGKADVFAFGFTSTMFSGGSLSVADASKKLTEYLKFNGVLDYDTIVFVAHSMGGLVVLHNLSRDVSNELLGKVPVVVLLGTPMSGADIASVADKVANNPALADMFGIDDNRFLQDLSDSWKSLPNKPEVICGFETMKTKGVLVVPWGSANYLCSRKAPPMDGASHETIVKPDGPNHPAVVLVVNALNELAFMDPKAKLETPDFVEEGDHLTLRMVSDQATARIVNASRSKVRYTIRQVSDAKQFLIVPKTPRYLPALTPESIDFYLLRKADKSEYSFILEDDTGVKRTVIARVEDLHAAAAALEQRTATAVAAINAHLVDKDNAKALASLRSDDAAAADAVARAAFDAIKARGGSTSDGVNWLLTADALAGAKLPQISTSALRKAEVAVPDIATTPAAQQLGGELAAALGIESIFMKTTTPKIGMSRTVAFELERPNVAKFEDIRGLAERMQQVPALKASGLVLEGDIFKEEGRNEKALKAYGEAAGLRATPGTSFKIKVLDESLAKDNIPDQKMRTEARARSRLEQNRIIDQRGAVRQ